MHAHTHTHQIYRMYTQCNKGEASYYSCHIITNTHITPIKAKTIKKQQFTGDTRKQKDRCMS